jgi:phage terminase large subunit GpA-like protein
LYSPVGWFSWAAAAKAFDAAKRSPERLQVFINTCLGETWQERGEAPEWQRLYDRREDYELGRVPARGLFLTAGADVQKDRIEVQVVAWGRERESWLVDYIVLDGDTAGTEVWERLTTVLASSYPHESGASMLIVKMAVDSGYQTQSVYAWARTQAPGKLIVIKGQDTGAVPVGQPALIDVTRAGRRSRHGVKVWPVATGILKSELYGWLRLDRPTEESGVRFPPGYCHFPMLGEEFFRQLTAEQLVSRVVKGYRKSEWIKGRERNEALDTRVYARAAANVFGLDRFRENDWLGLEEAVRPRPPAPQPPQQPTSQTDRKIYWPDRNESWLRRGQSSGFRILGRFNLE